MAMRRRHQSLVVLTLCAATVVACLPLDRAEQLLPGTVRGQARFSGEGREDVAVALSNSKLVRASDAAGDFLIGGLVEGTHGLRLREDDDDDGITDRGAAVRFSMPTTATGLAGVDLGPVALRGTVTVSGTISDDDGNGLEDLVVVVTRFELDKTAEVYLPLLDDDGDGTVSYSLRGVIPGAVEVQAFAAGNRASAVRVIDVKDDRDEAGIDLAVVGTDLVPVTTTVSPLLPTARFVLVAVDAGPNAPALQEGRVGTVIDVEAGIYDVWFFAGDASDTTPIAVLPRQVARPLATSSSDTALQWGPALRGALSGIDGTENTLPVVTALPEPRVLVATTPGAQTIIPLTIVDPDGDDITIEVVSAPEDSGLVFSISGTDVVVTFIGDITAAGVLFSRTPIRIVVRDGRGVLEQQIGVVVIADAIFIGPGREPETDSHWLGGIAAPLTGAIVVESALQIAESAEFLALDLRAAIDVAGELKVNRVFSSNGDGLIEADTLAMGGTDSVPGRLEGQVRNTNISVNGVVELRKLRVFETEGNSSLGMSVVGKLLLDSDSLAVQLDMPVFFSGESVLRLRGGAVAHFTKQVGLGFVDCDLESGLAFEHDDARAALKVQSAQLLQIGSLTFTGSGGALFELAAEVTVRGQMRLDGAIAVQLDSELTEIVMRMGSLVMTSSDATLTADVVVGIAGDTRRQPLNGTIIGNVTIDGDVALAGDLIALKSDGNGGFDGNVDLSLTGILHFGAGTGVKTDNMAIAGHLDLNGGGLLEIVGGDDALLFDAAATVASVAPFSHRLVSTPQFVGDPLVIFNKNPNAALAFDVVDLTSNTLLVRSGAVTVRELILGAEASVEVELDGSPPASVTVETCSGAGAAPVCPTP